MEEIAGGIYLIPGENEGRFPYSHSILIRDDITALIDTGCGIDTLKEVEESFRPDMVIYSHAHPDHCSGSYLFPSERLWGPREHGESTGILDRMAERLITPEIHGEWIAFMKDVAGFRDFRAGNFFSDGHLFNFGKTVMEAVHTPGHLDDHYCFYLPRERVMLSTDIDFTSFGPWYGNPESNIDEFIRSMNRIRTYDMEAVVSSHMGVIREGIGEGLDAFLDVFEERDREILAFLDAPRSIHDFVQEALIYRGYPLLEGILRFFEEQMVLKHLARLKAAGKVRMSGAFLERI
jgi:glyoxylase-like metal-dependent hydrolase (beta-lactamase superfamily II)